MLLWKPKLTREKVESRHALLVKYYMTANCHHFLAFSTQRNFVTTETLINEGNVYGASTSTP